MCLCVWHGLNEIVWHDSLPMELCLNMTTFEAHILDDKHTIDINFL